MKDLAAYKRRMEKKIAQKKSRFNFAEKTSRDASSRSKRGVAVRNHNKALIESACDAQDTFSLDELEEHAAKSK